MCQRLYRPGYSMPELSTPPAAVDGLGDALEFGRFERLRGAGDGDAATGCHSVESTWGPFYEVWPGARRVIRKSDRRLRAAALEEHRLQAAPPLKVGESSHRGRAYHSQPGHAARVSGMRQAVAAPVMTSAAALSLPWSSP